MNNNYQEYINKKRQRKEAFYRIWLGAQQILQYPWLILFMISIWIPFPIIWKIINNIMPTYFIPTSLQEIVNAIGFILLIMLFILLEVAFVRVVGVLTARKIESNLVIAFRGLKATYSCPILIKLKKDKHTGVTVSEFHSEIPLKEWRNAMDSIADILNVHFVNPCIEYGGKNNDNGRIIRLYTAKGRKLPERGILYDDEL